MWLQGLFHELVECGGQLKAVLEESDSCEDIEAEPGS